MQLLGNLFTIIIFVSMFGSLFSLLQLFGRKALRLPMPLWVGVAGILLFLLPVAVPEVQLIPPEETLWVSGYTVAFQIWGAGVVLFLLLFALRAFLAYKAVRRYPLCTDERVLKIYSACAKKVGLAALPPMRIGTLKTPACVVLLLRPEVIISKEVVSTLSEQEWTIVLTHELAHIKRRHPLFERLFDIACCLHWFNPVAWLARHEFASFCELDCDKTALKNLESIAPAGEYAMTMLRLIALSQAEPRFTGGTMGALDFFLTRQRLEELFQTPTLTKRRIAATCFLLFLAGALMLSAMTSRSMFYPYPALMGGEEWSEQSYEQQPH